MPPRPPSRRDLEVRAAAARRALAEDAAPLGPRLLLMAALEQASLCIDGRLGQRGRSWGDDFSEGYGEDEDGQSYEFYYEGWFGEGGEGMLLEWDREDDEDGEALVDAIDEGQDAALDAPPSRALLRAAAWPLPPNAALFTASMLNVSRPVRRLVRYLARVDWGGGPEAARRAVHGPLSPADESPLTRAAMYLSANAVRGFMHSEPRPYVDDPSGSMGLTALAAAVAGSLGEAPVDRGPDVDLRRNLEREGELRGAVARTITALRRGSLPCSLDARLGRRHPFAGGTALHAACGPIRRDWEGRVLCAGLSALLWGRGGARLRRGLDLEATDDKGQTALELAIASRREDAAALLRQAGARDPAQAAEEEEETTTATTATALAAELAAATLEDAPPQRREDQANNGGSNGTAANGGNGSRENKNEQ